MLKGLFDLTIEDDEEMCDMVSIEQLDAAYTQRAIAVTLFAKMARRLGYTVGVGKDNNEDWEDSWRNVLYVDLPNEGQFSWHFSPNDLELLKGFPKYTGKWDGYYNSRDVEFVKDIE